LNSRAFRSLLELQLARTELAQSYEVGLIQMTPTPDLDDSDAVALSSLARRAWSLRRFGDASIEVSHAFVLPALLRVEAPSLEERARLWRQTVGAVADEEASIQAAIDERCFELYEIDEAERLIISEGFGRKNSSSETDPDVDADGEEDEIIPALDATSLVAGLVSWAVSVAFGRFDVRLATDAYGLPQEPEPFDQLPAFSPGVLRDEDGLLAKDVPPDYPLAFPASGVLVDDPGDARDLTAGVRAVFEVVFGENADALWDEAAALLEPRSRDLRAWLRSTLFEHHLKQHSKSRRKAPIYWQLATPSASYSVWLYAHRIGRDTLYQVLNDLVSPKLQAEERKLHALREEAGPNPSSSQRKDLAAQEAFVQELRVLRDEVALVAPLWNPDLNDGLVIVAAPVWRLVPQLRSWQKELKTHWNALCAGKYDWAQLAMHLWPERVVPKCAEDRSLAIAHDLEDVFWEKDADGKWAARREPTRPIAELVAERTSPAVKDALESVLSAPPLSTGKRSRKVAA
jgi:hypothetical protein